MAIYKWGVGSGPPAPGGVPPTPRWGGPGGHMGMGWATYGVWGAMEVVVEVYGLIASN